jgi:hypothetical protein
LIKPPANVLATSPEPRTPIFTSISYELLPWISNRPDIHATSSEKHIRARLP